MTDDASANRSRNRREHRRTADSDRSVPTDRESPVGAPVIRGDESVTGNRARRAVQFDPTDPDSVAEAAETVANFAVGRAGDDNLFMLRGAAACAALVRGVGSYKAAAERANATLESVVGDEPDPGAPAEGSTDGAAIDDAEGDGGSSPADDSPTVTVSFIRKWARVHDLPRSVRRQVALGNIAPTAAKHVARVGGESRLLLAWAVLDGDLTVREVRSVASAVNDGVPIDEALAAHGVALGRMELRLPPATYRDLRREASLADVDPGELVAEALTEYFE